MRKPIFGLLPFVGTIALMVLFVLVLGGINPRVAFADFTEGKKAFDAEDYSTAFRYWHTSADQGEAKSQLELARLYRDGKGTNEDKIVASLYFTLAAQQQIKVAAKEQQDLVEGLSEEELVLAQKLVASWEPVDAKSSPEKTELNSQEKEALRWFKAAEKGTVKTIKEMISGGIDLNKRDKDGWTALMLAALNNHKVTSKILIEAGADLNIADPLGMTALMAASVAGNKLLVEFMVKSGADIEQEDTVGETAEYMAEQAGHVTIARYFSTLELPEEQIKEAQELLIALGYLEGSADGKTGPKTSEAIKKFQKSSGQKQTGLVRKLLLETLEDKVTNRPLLPVEKTESPFEAASVTAE
ncbi:ankyrin repeat domain-containing protein [Kiloniella sp. EL199]|uniref:ankyrin repeat domain-containing protein n=1 Tax=Kiloniella sp. EL199 TaxID=2107581 RepID=UPI0013C4C2CD|nr:ankyrin repeat domain-containing protein [Kiloniella sp. EL199]